MIHNRLGADNSPTLPHQRDALRDSMLVEARSWQHRQGCDLADLPSRARHPRDKKVTAEMSSMPSLFKRM